MTASRSKGPTHPEVPRTDPLADLRVPDSMPGAAILLDALQDRDTDMLEVGVFDQAWHDDAATAAVTAWHADRVATLSLHRGGSCACRYLAAMALRVTVGVALPEAVEGEGERETDGRD